MVTAIVVFCLSSERRLFQFLKKEQSNNTDETR